MVTVVVFEFCVMRCQPLRRALANQGKSIKMYHKELAELLSDIGEKIYEFQLTGYSFEEWFNWELYSKLKQAGYVVTPKPAIHTQYKSYADLLINDPIRKVDTFVEVKLIHDFTGNKWLPEIENDRKALQAIKMENPSQGLQLLLIASSHKDVLNHPYWKPWLEKLSFWSMEPNLRVESKYSLGSIIVMGWMLG
ncbi:hypothetical protein [Vibrio cholerae]|uniref:hypothetical protein n=1 Tax=Vibrio cholerae TaxID=666 RepID=UPI00157AFF85|nr:hypothetical protein [Vibrio cholerae]